MKNKIAFITVRCTHYRVKLFEKLSKKYDIRFLFTVGNKKANNKKLLDYLGDFQFQYLKSWLVHSINICYSLLNPTYYRENNIIIKDINGVFDLPVSFLFSKILRKPFILWTGLWFSRRAFIYRNFYN